MPKQKRKRECPAQIRMSPDDEKIVRALIKKKGGTIPSVTREAWRLLAAKEEVSLAT